MTIATLRVLKESGDRHKLVIPRNIWEGEQLHYGDYVEINVRRLEKTPELEHAVDVLKRIEIHRKQMLNTLDECILFGFDIGPMRDMCEEALIMLDERAKEIRQTIAAYNSMRQK